MPIVYITCPITSKPDPTHFTVWSVSELELIFKVQNVTINVACPYCEAKKHVWDCKGGSSWRKREGSKVSFSLFLIAEGYLFIK